jgi:HK97 gp10 family phage protein
VALAQMLTNKALEVERHAKRLCPVDTGNLRRSITSGLSFDLGIPIGVCAATAPYSAYVEYGTSRSPAQPFLRPALERVNK